MKIFLSFLMIVSTANAQVESVPLKKGELAPYEGVLLSNKKANEIKDELVEKDLLKQENDSLKKSVDLFKLKDQYSEDQIQKLLQSNSKLVDANLRQNNKYEPVLWFALGVLATGLTFYAAKEIVD